MRYTRSFLASYEPWLLPEGRSAADPASQRVYVPRPERSLIITYSNNNTSITQVHVVLHCVRTLYARAQLRSLRIRGVKHDHSCAETIVPALEKVTRHLMYNNAERIGHRSRLKASRVSEAYSLSILRAVI